MNDAIEYKFWTVCLIKKGDRVLLLNRQHDSFKGYIPPGGRVDFPEGFVDGAIREVKEETGLTVRNLVFKGLYHYVDPVKRARHMIFNYITEDFDGELLENSPEGDPGWYSIDELDQLPMQASIKRRMPYFFEEGTFDIKIVWQDSTNREGEVIIQKT